MTSSWSSRVPVSSPTRIIRAAVEGNSLVAASGIASPSPCSMASPTPPSERMKTRLRSESVATRIASGSATPAPAIEPSTRQKRSTNAKRTASPTTGTWSTTQSRAYRPRSVRTARR